MTNGAAMEDASRVQMGPHTAPPRRPREGITEELLKPANALASTALFALALVLQVFSQFAAGVGMLVASTLWLIVASSHTLITRHAARHPAARVATPPDLALWRRAVPGAITSLRLPAAFVAMLLALDGQIAMSFWWYLAAVASDVLDGLAATLLRARTPWGAEYDAFTDAASNMIYGLGLFAAYIQADQVGPAVALSLLVLLFTVPRKLKLIDSTHHSISAKLMSGFFRLVLLAMPVLTLDGDRTALLAGMAGIVVVAIVYEGPKTWVEMRSGARPVR
jgi:phosphatidylglycerophosphate synthase